MTGPVTYKTIISSTPPSSSDASSSSSGESREDVSVDELTVLTVSFSAQYHSGDDLRAQVVNALRQFARIEIQLPYSLLQHGTVLSELLKINNSAVRAELIEFINIAHDLGMDKNITTIEHFEQLNKSYEALYELDFMKGTTYLAFTHWLSSNSDVFSLWMTDSNITTSKNIKLNSALLQQERLTQAVHSISLREEPLILALRRVTLKILLVRLLVAF